MTEPELIQYIYTSFQDIQLEDGVGLYEADCIDGYLVPTHPEYIRWKEKDERHNWEKILPLFISNNPNERVNTSNYFFMDAKGKRFHLPCYLLQDLDTRFQGNNPIISDIRFKKGDLSDYEILTALQKQTLFDFLVFQLGLFMENENEIDFETYSEAKTILESAWQ